TRQSGYRPARQQPRKAKRSTDSVGRPSRKIEASSGFGFIAFAWVAGIGLGIYFFVNMMTVVTAPAHFVLAIETSGPSTAVVTSRNPGQLPQLASYIVHALENPEAEFQVKVETLTINPRNYYFGDNVNMYGGTGNVGVAA
ncbi:DUF6232 family protein, partial [Streptomyces flaveolus]|uniref:DUF6232 family protein n=1 Tax=Streptomyces flaveolus TaxID=67297 RepID=UPI0033A18505